MLEYDEWVVPGEVEYAEKKAAEIGSQIENYHKTSLRGDWMRDDWTVYIQVTEHVIGKFCVTVPKDVWQYAIYDIDISNSMMLDWFQDEVAPIDEPMIFDLPADDIRSRLPEWDESLLPDESRKDILRMHSARYKVVCGIKDLDGDYDGIKEAYNLDNTKCSKIMETFFKKLDTRNRPVTFTELEEQIGKHIMSYEVHLFDYVGCYYEPWDFQLAMSEKDVIDAIRDAYMNASKRSRRIIPDKFDRMNLGRGDGLDSQLIELMNYECLYQGKAGDLVIHFLFDFKNMKIVMAYPVMKEVQVAETSREYHYYDKELKQFDWEDFSRIRKTWE